MKKVFLTCVVFALWSLSANANTLRYDGIPLDIKVSAGRDTLLQFVEPQLVGQPKASKKVLKLTPSKGRVLIEPLSDSSEVVKVYFRGVNTGEVTMADIKIGDYENIPRVYTIRTIDDELRKEAEQVRSDRQSVAESTSQLNTNDRAKLLIRYVNQHVNREKGTHTIIEEFPFAIQRVNTRLDAPVRGFYRKGLLSAELVDVYQGGGLTALLVVVTNVTSSKVKFDPTLVRGHWHSAQPWKVEFEPSERGVVVVVAEGGVPDAMMKVMSEAEL